jgi:hypothetical protein
MKLALLVATPVRDAPQADRRSLGLRTDGAKSELVGSLGGSAAALESVRLGLEWLARHQADDGRWSLNRYHKLAPGEPNSGAGSIDCDSAATGLAILPFLADGHTHRDGAHRATVERGLNWLLKLQRETGELTSDEKSRVRMYGHGIATIAICEAYGMTGDAALRGPCERAIRFIVEAQDPKSGGWRYQPREPGDTSVVGWQVMALKSGQIAGLEVPAETWEQTRKFLASVEGKNASVGTFGYQNSNATPAMTAEALLCLEYLDARRDDPRLEAGTRYLLKNLPQPGRESSYYWYYATQALFHRQGPEWLAWNNALVPLLTDSQIKTGPHSGSWAPSDRWEYQGGRLYATALRLMMLEVYYRYLPLYRPL